MQDPDTAGLGDLLLATLRQQTGHPDLAFDGEPQRLAGGFWADLVTFRLADAPRGLEGDLVARVMPDPQTAKRETVIQTAVAGQGFPTPRVRIAGGPDSPLGRAYMVMDLAVGAPMLADLDGARALVRLPMLARRLPRVLAAAAAELHTLDTSAVERDLVTFRVVRPSLAELLAEVAAAATALGRHDLVAAVDALRSRQPASEPDVVCHGDLHPFNVIIDPAGEFTLLDWSVSGLAPRSFDLGFTVLMLRHPPLVAPRALAPLVGMAGRQLARSFLRHYQAVSGVTIDEAELAWHTAIHALRALADVAAWTAGGTLEDHASHPWLTIEGALLDELAEVSGVRVARSS